MHILSEKIWNGLRQSHGHNTQIVFCMCKININQLNLSSFLFHISPLLDTYEEKPNIVRNLIYSDILVILANFQILKMFPNIEIRKNLKS